MLKRTIYAVFVVLGYLSFVPKADCLTSFTVIPNNGNPIYVTEGAGSLTLAWDYNADGRTVREVLLVYTTGGHEVVVAGKTPNQPLQIQPGVGYDGRVTFRGRATFEISNIVPSDSRIYKCRVRFVTYNPPDISRSNVEVVVVVRPSITLKSPTPVELDECSSTTLLCFATGNPKPTYTWKRESTIVQENADSNYTIASANKIHTGLYTCAATVNASGLGQYSDVYSVDVKVKYKPQVFSLSSNQTLNEGRDALFYCKAVAYPTAITYNWFKEGSAIVSDPIGEFFVDSVGSQSRLRVKRIKKDSAGRYSCSGTNTFGTGEQKAVFLKVNLPPIFSGQTLPTTRQVKEENSSVSYSCVAEAKPAAKIQWVLNGKNLTNSPTYNISGSFQAIQGSKLFKTFSYLDIAKITWRQYGNFSCVAYNEAGQVRQNTELEVRYRPVVQFPADHPHNLTLREGETATFSCKTIGNPPTTAQKWQFKGVDIPGESCSGCTTIIFQKGAVSQLDAGWYSCIGTNSLGDGPPASAQLLIKRFSTSAPFEPAKVNKDVIYGPVIAVLGLMFISFIVYFIIQQRRRKVNGTKTFNCSDSFNTVTYHEF